ncbi:MAG TPA: lasso peptide biosynthesis B2 protein [Verrucomicrobiae bacterium]|nr:lasso peptide biosynthesis B2 protein [Verrucomicrobiae bacterium]
MIRKLRKLARLGWREYCLLAEAWLCLCAARFALWLLPFPRLWTPPRLSAGSRFTPRQIAWAIAAAAPFVPSSTCLVRALAAQRLFARKGHDAAVRIGVANSSGEFAAHAWLDYAGDSIVGAVSSPRYTRICSLEPRV